MDSQEQFWLLKANQTFWWIVSIQTFTGLFQLFEIMFPQSEKHRLVNVCYTILTITIFIYLYSAVKTQNVQKFYICTILQYLRLVIRPWDFEDTRELEGDDWPLLVNYHCVLQLVQLIMIIFNFKQTNRSKITIVFFIFLCILTATVGTYGRKNITEIAGKYVATVLFQSILFGYFGQLLASSNLD